MSKWYKNSNFRNLVDIHIPSGDDSLINFSPVRYADMMEKAKVDTAYIYASNCLGLCLYPTNVGIRHSITEKFDLFGETVAEIKKRGIGVVGYLNNWCSDVANAHPEWQIVRFDGKTELDVSRFGTCCPNSPYREYFLKLVDEMVSSYEISGLWVDMLGFYTPVCKCDYCREKFKRETGFDIPETVDFTNEVYVKYLDFKCNTVSEFVKQIRETALKARPGISVCLQGASWADSYLTGTSDQYFAQSDFCSGDFYGTKEETDVICRVLQSLSSNSPFEYMTSRTPSLKNHTGMKSFNSLALQAMASILSGGSFLFIDAIDPSGEMDENVYKTMAKIKDLIVPFYEYIDHSANILRDVAIYMNFDSFMPVENTEKPISMMYEPKDDRAVHRLGKISKKLLFEGIDHDILTEKSINDLDKYKCVIIPDLGRMKKSEVQKFREYVKNGGSLYVSGKSSLLDTDGTLYDDFMLSDVMGVSYVNDVEMTPTFITPQKDEELFLPHTKKYPCMYKGKQIKVVAKEDTNVLATVTHPVSMSSDNKKYTSAISDPPVNHTDMPSITENFFGNGRVIYSAAAIEYEPDSDSKDLFNRIIKRLAGDFNLTLEAPECVECVLRYSEDKKRYTVSILNYQEYDRIIPVYEIGIKIKLDAKPINISAVQGNVSYTYENNKICLKLEKLDMFDIIVIDCE